MIQRIQTVYMLIAELLVGILFFVPFGEIAGKEGIIFRVGMKGIFPEGTPKPEAISSNWPIVIIWVLSLILIIVGIFLFENRKRQMRLSLINILILIALCCLIFFEVLSGSQQLSGHYSFSIYFVFPAIAAILLLMAYRAIAKDEALVRSIDRIR
jgi:hypothetical protein